jgi:hypothetical protein
MMCRGGLRRWLAVVLLGAGFSSAQATQIVIVNQDGAGEGFNDTTAVAPVRDNPGTTLGEQRLNVFRQAAKVWEAVIGSDVTITVAARFDPLTCTATQAVLGSAGTTSVHRNFTGAPVGNTWYAQALANSLANRDLSTNADISATFNADIDNNNNCLKNKNWYYGLDGQRPAGTIELLSVVMHEIGHGLGFQTFVDVTTGARFNNFNDAFMLNLEDHSLSTPKTWDQLTNAGRLASASKTSYLHWTGPQVTALVSNYTGGINQGHVRMYAPATISAGSSVSHFSNAVAPNELMEPIDTGPKTGPGLALPLLQDIGWAAFADASPVIAVLGDQQAQDGETIAVGVLVLDNDTPLNSLNLSAASSNSVIVAPSGLSFSGSGRQRTLSVTPVVGSSGSVTIDVTVSDATSSATESFTLNVTLNHPPTVAVSSPANGSVYLDTDFVSLQASASDIEDGDVSASLGWSSDIDGALGDGNVVVQLSAGVHTLTATATDSLGKSTSVSRTVTSYGSGDTDSDGLADNWEFSHFGSLAQGGAGDFDSDGLTNLEEFGLGTVPTLPDTDGDGVSDGDEVNVYGINPTFSNKGDVGPRGAPDGQLNGGDLVVMSRLVTGATPPSSLETVLADVNNDGQRNAADMLLLQRAILQGNPL